MSSECAECVRLRKQIAADAAVWATVVRLVECFEAAEEADGPVVALGWQVAAEEAYQALCAFVDARRAATDSATGEGAG